MFNRDRLDNLGAVTFGQTDECVETSRGVWIFFFFRNSPKNGQKKWWVHFVIDLMKH